MGNGDTNKKCEKCEKCGASEFYYKLDMRYCQYCKNTIKVRDILYPPLDTVDFTQIACSGHQIFR